MMKFLLVPVFALFALVLLIRLFRRRSGRELARLYAQAQAILTIANYTAQYVQDSYRRPCAELLARTAALPCYAQALAVPAPARTAKGKRARLVVLDMQATLAQSRRTLRSYAAQPLTRRHRKYLRNEAARIGMKYKRLREIGHTVY